MNAVVEFEPVALAVAEYSPTAAALADLRARLANVAYDVSTTKGMDIAKKDRAEVRGLRTALEAKRVELKAPALERSRLIDAEAKALTAELVALEKPIDDQIKAEERRKEVEKAAREQAEREAAAVIQGRIDAIRALAIIPAGVKAAGISVSIDNLNAVEVSLEAYGDRAGEAGQAKVQTLARLGELHEAAAAFEAEQARIASEREELARLRAEQEAHDKAERDRIAAEQAAEAKRLADERKAFEKEQAAARAEAKKREDADRVRRDEEDRKAREARAAEDLRIARERAELEAQQRAIREAEEAKAAAERKAEQDRLDAIAKQQREAAAAEQRRLDEEAAARRAEAERKHAADMKVREAAPMLLAALKRMRAVAGNIGSSIPELEQALRDADAAIALATGEQA
jgi:colicin import membrane protein